MDLVITEKPSVAKVIADVIGARINRTDWYEGNGYCVTWLVGHLFELDAMEGHVPWDRQHLPVRAESWMLVPRRTDRDGRSVTARIAVLKRLFSECDTVIAATDAGKEGELIFRNTYEYFGCTKPWRRFWASSLTEKSIRNGFDTLMDGHEKDNLYSAAKARSRFDWLVGVNATRAITVACGEDGSRHNLLLSMGRVQSTALYLICRRYVLYKQFVPKPYWNIAGTSMKDGVEIRWRDPARHTDEGEAGEVLERIRRAGNLVVKEVERERDYVLPPRLFDVDTMEKLANARFGYPLEQSHDIAQSLYEKGFISYPRTGSRYISEDVFETVPDILETLSYDRDYGAAAASMQKDSLMGVTPLNDRSVDDSKLTDHHAIIPTEKRPEKLTDEEWNIYRLIVGRFLEAFSPDAVYERMKVVFEPLEEDATGGEALTVVARGRVERYAGWKAVNRDGADDEDVDEEADVEDGYQEYDGPLADFFEGEIVAVNGVDPEMKYTQPEPVLTDATFLTELETAGSRTGNKAFAKALKEAGIGTPATRSEVLKTLIDRGYVLRDKRRLIPTDLGLEMFVAIKDMPIANVTLTAQLEMKLKDIEDGKASAEDFEKEAAVFSDTTVSEIFGSSSMDHLRRRIAYVREKEIIRCPVCGRELKEGGSCVYCDRRAGGCGWRMPTVVAHRKLTKDMVRTLIRTGRTASPVRGLKRNDGTEFEARLQLESNGDITFVSRYSGK